MREYFQVNVSKYVKGRNFDVVRPASLNNPKDNAVMFIFGRYMEYADSFLKCNNCLIFWPEEIDIPDDIRNRHAVVKCSVPKNGYCGFFRENNITYYPAVEDFEVLNGAYIAKTAKVGRNCVILPGAYIGGEVEVGDNCYIGTGARLVGEIHIGDNVVIRENSVIGADGLSTDRDENGKALTMPQFGGVIIEDDVQIGALTVIGRGAIDNTILKRGSKIDNSTFISHNVVLGEDSFVVGETIMFGSSSTGKQAFISGNSTIRDGRHIGDKAIVGMGWDDDIDTAMLYSDYIKFESLCKTQLGSRFFLQTRETEPNACLCFDKLRMNETTLIIDNMIDKDIHQGIDIDIQPIYNVPDNVFKRKIQLLNALLYMLLQTEHIPKNHNLFFQTGAKLCLFLFRGKFRNMLKERCFKNMARYKHGYH